MDLQLVQMAIICEPKACPVIPATNGVRKLRFQRYGSSRGKSGGMRLCYAYFEEHKKVILMLVYPKSIKEDITVEDKRNLRSAMERIEKELESPAS